MSLLLLKTPPKTFAFRPRELKQLVPPRRPRAVHHPHTSLLSVRRQEGGEQHRVVGLREPDRLVARHQAAAAGRHSASAPQLRHRGHAERAQAPAAAAPRHGPAGTPRQLRRHTGLSNPTQKRR